MPDSSPQSETASDGRGIAALRLALGMLAVLASVILGTPQCLGAPRADEPSVMATFLFHFAQFTTWPDAAFTNAQAPFVVGIVGSNHLEGRIEEVFRNEKVGTRDVQVRRLTAADSPAACHLLFVGDPDDARVRRVLDDVRGHPVLTVGARPRFCEDGGLVAFAVESGKVTFQIHRDLARQVGLAIHSRILSMARIYRSEEGR